MNSGADVECLGTGHLLEGVGWCKWDEGHTFLFTQKWVLKQCCREVQQVAVLKQHYQLHTAQELVQAKLTSTGKVLLTYRLHNATFVSLEETSLALFLTSMFT